VVGVNLLEEVLEVLLDHFPVEHLGSLKFVSDPGLELTSLEDVVVVVVMFLEDILDKGSAIGVHLK
jgi:hypothetical protein